MFKRDPMEQIFTGKWYPWYPEKALTSESIDGLTLAEEGAYRRALDKAWIKGSLPADPKEAAGVIGKGCTVKIAAKVLTLFVPVKGNKKRVVNLSQERKREEQAEKHKKAVERAENAANKRWSEANKNKGADATSTPQALLKDAIKNKNKIKEEEIRENHQEQGAEKTEERNNVLPLSPSFPNSESMSGRPRGFRGVAVNEDAEAKLMLWLDAIAPALGAKSRHTIADSHNWTDVCIKAISEGRTSTELVEAIHSELERTAETPQYFSAKGVLKRLQMATAKPARRKFIH